MDVNATPLDPRSPCGALPSLYLSSLLCLGTVSFSICVLAEQAAYGYSETQETALVQDSAIDAATLSEDSLNLDQYSVLQSWEQVQINSEAEPLSHLVDDFDQNQETPETATLDITATENTAAENTPEQAIDSSLSSDNPTFFRSHFVDLEQDNDSETTDATQWTTIESEISEPAISEPAISELEITDTNITEPEATETGVTEREPASELEPVSEQASEPEQLAEVEQSEATEQSGSSPVGSLQDSTLAYTDASLLPTLEVTQLPEEPQLEPREEPTSTPTDDFDRLQLRTQGVYLFEENESSARIRLTGSYALTPNVLFGSTLDWTTGDAFFQSDESGFSVNELFVTVSPPTVPELRATFGMIDLTSYFDRNSFAKDVATQFFNPVFQTNPALSAAGINSRPGVLVNWDVTDNLSLRGAAFSSDRDLDDFQFDAAAAEVAFRFGNAILRGTYVTDRDAGYNDGFQEIYSFDRGNGDFGLEPGDREIAYGLNAEVFIPELNLGFFGRYGWYNNETLDVGGTTYSVGLNALDLFFPDDRLGLAYGRQLSNNELRDEQDDTIPDVMELFYDVRVLPFLRVGVSLQQRNGFSETFAGFRIRGDLDLAGLWR
ncbi:MAG TPA: hypothetical protein V6C65_37590 [Allocoleopsis sp.]